MYKISDVQIFQSQCDLGEGLYVARDNAYWLDINANRVWCTQPELNSVTLECQPSVIFAQHRQTLEIAADSGRVYVNQQLQVERFAAWQGLQHSLADYRSNDGVAIADIRLIGFMHRSNPVDNPGYVYALIDDRLQLFDSEIHIPNSFVPLSEREVLISDSLSSEIWKYSFDQDYQLQTKVLWAKLDPAVSPDGACYFEEKVWLALWDGSGLAIFDSNGVQQQILELPVLRPTNCKIDKMNRGIWITSAQEGMSESQLRQYPQSGNTFFYQLNQIGVN